LSRGGTPITVIDSEHRLYARHDFENLRVSID
jgi:hypothetical protein